jgi:CRP-like cAMP-binding protein
MTSASDTIANLSFMLGLDGDVRAKVAAALIETSRRELVAKGSALFRAGDDASADEGYVLLEGAAVIARPDGPAVEVRAPALLGEMKQFNPENRRMADVTATKDLDVLRFNWAALYDNLAQRLTSEQVAAFREELRRYAWTHFLGDDM